MNIEVCIDILWPTRVKVTFDNYDIWMTHKDACILRDKLKHELNPASTKVVTYMNEEYDV